MGAPKQKWTAEEEAALKAGVVKHGAGKWRTILTDPEFSAILRMRSNVDLKVCLFQPPSRLWEVLQKLSFIILFLSGWECTITVLCFDQISKVMACPCCTSINALNC